MTKRLRKDYHSLERTDLPMVSIVIPVYNGANYMREAIDSALAQTYPNCEVIVVNDGSRDSGKTDRIARSYGDRIQYVSQENGGVAAALNTGIRYMRGDYFAWLSHDDVYKPQKIAAQMEVMQGLPIDTILYAGVELIYMYAPRDRIPVDHARWYSDQLLRSFLAPIVNSLVNGCTVLFHRSHFDRAGYFDVTRKTTQDYDFWLRLFRGASVRYCPQTNVISRQHAQQGSHTIPSHAEEALRFWVELCETLTDEEIETMGITRPRFYRLLYDNYVNTDMQLVADYLSGTVAFAESKELDDAPCEMERAARAEREYVEQSYLELRKRHPLAFAVERLREIGIKRFLQRMICKLLRNQTAGVSEA